jgi:hypothetical protein
MLGIAFSKGIKPDIGPGQPSQLRIRQKYAPGPMARLTTEGSAHHINEQQVSVCEAYR